MNKVTVGMKTDHREMYWTRATYLHVFISAHIRSTWEEGFIIASIIIKTTDHGCKFLPSDEVFTPISNLPHVSQLCSKKSESYILQVTLNYVLRI